MAALGLGWIATPSDPMQLQAGFPWLWFAPVAVALRYGVIPGIASSAMLLLAWYIYAQSGHAFALPRSHFLGGLLLTLVCGEFSARWRLRLRRTTEQSAYLDERVERVTKRLYLLRLSHDRLEQDLLLRPTTMRDALARWRSQMIESAETGPLPGAYAFLQFLGQHCQLEAAALYAVIDSADSADSKDSKHGASSSSAPMFSTAAKIGASPPLTPGDPLVAYALEHRELAHLQVDGLDDNVPIRHLVVAPIINSEGRLLGMLAVRRMPFFALQHENLQLLAVLIGAYADNVTHAPGIRAILSVLPACPEDFAEELARLSRIQREFDIDSHIVVILFGAHPSAIEARQYVEASRRTPDMAWLPDAPMARAAFVNLLPISSPATVAGYLSRTEAGLRDRFGADFKALNIETITIPLSHGAALDTLARTLYGSLLRAQA